MKTVFRLFIGIIILVVAVGATGVAILASTSPEEIRDFVAGQVKSATGREMVIKGALDLEISLVPSLVMNDVTFANAKWASQPNMLSLKRLEAGLELLPLLQGDIRLTQIVLIEPKINLETNTKGLGNWQFEDDAVPSDKKAGDTSGSTSIPILSRLLIENGEFNFKDGGKGETLSLTLAKVKVDVAGRDGPTVIELKGGYNGTPFEVNGRAASLYRLIEDPSNYAVDLTAQLLATTLQLKGNVKRPLSDRKIDIKLAIVAGDINNTVGLAVKLAPQLGDIKLPPLGALQASVRIHGTPSAINLSDLAFAVGPTDSLTLTGGGQITGLPAKPVYRLNFAAKGSDLRPFSELAGVEFAKAPPYEISGVFSQPKGNFAIDDFNLKLGASNISGNIVASLKSKIPHIKADLTSDKFDLADVLAVLPPSQAAPAKSKKDDGRVFPNDPLPLDGLRAATLDIKFLGRDVLLSNAQLKDLNIGLKLNNGKLELAPFAAEFSKGKMTGTVTLDSSLAKPKLSMKFQAKGTDVGKLLKDMAVSDLITGRADTRLTLTGSGASVRQIMAGLNGQTEIVMSEGQVATKYLDLVAADLVKAVMPGGANTTKINCMVNRFDIKKGIATNTAFLFDTEKMTISGGGIIDLRSEKLDLRIKPQPKDASLVSLAVPIDIGGTLKSPSVRPSTTAVLKGIAGLALTAVNPIALLALTVSKGTSDKNPCVAALATAKSSSQRGAKTAPPPQKKSKNPISTITEGITGGLKSLFGGK